MENRVLIIGLDAATFDLIEPWAAEGRLPNLASLMEGGVYGDLLSVPNMNSAPAWSTFATGKGPGEHGIFYFSRLKPDSYEIEPINASYRMGETFWRAASNNDKRVVVMNVPISYPAEWVNGYLVAGLDTPYVGCDGFTHPASLSQELQQNVGEYEIEAGMPSLIKAGKLDQAIARAEWTATRRRKAAEYLMDKQSWDLFIVVFTGIDVIQHFFWKYMDAEEESPKVLKYRNTIRDFYAFMDEQVGKLLNKAGDDVSVILVSDHGAGPLCEATKILPDWLHQNGFLRLMEPGAQGIIKRSGLRAVKSLYHVIDVNLTRNQKLVLARFFPGTRSKVESTVLLGDIDWSMTKVYAAESRNELRINLKGREPLGSVAPGQEYEEVREKLMQELLAWRSPSGERYVKQVFKREEVYAGRFIEQAPDILIHWNPIGGEITKNAVDLFNYNVNGDHLPNGILVAHGQLFKKARQISGARLLDVAPTVLHMLGLRVPDDMEGIVLQDLFAPAHLQEVTFAEKDAEKSAETAERSVVEYSEDDKNKIEERLRELGYID
jgi:predicted AlkP superfamily phosphohydrolase/phosphomutase